MQLLPDHWYPILESREVKAQKPLGVERLGLELVLWRSPDGTLRCHLDRCPHLSAALSKGHLKGDQIVCPFHGFEFDATGQCQHIPAKGCQGRMPAGMALQSFPVCEAHGLIWLWWGSARETYPAPPFFDELKAWRYGTVQARWPVHYTRAIENQLDVAHLPFVHRTTIGAGGRSFVDGPYVESGQENGVEGIKVWVTNAQDHGQEHRSQSELAALAVGQEPSLHFIFPGLWKLNIGAKMKNFIAFVPINERETLYYLRSYHRTQNPVLAKLFETTTGISNRFILNQDRRVVVTQRPYDSSEASDERMIGADRAISQFRRLYRQLMTPGERELLQHPTSLKAPVRTDVD